MDGWVDTSNRCEIRRRLGWARPGYRWEGIEVLLKVGWIDIVHLDGQYFSAVMRIYWFPPLLPNGLAS